MSEAQLSERFKREFNKSLDRVFNREISQTQHEENVSTLMENYKTDVQNIMTGKYTFLP